MSRPVYEREVTRRRSRLIREPVPQPEPVEPPAAPAPEPRGFITEDDAAEDAGFKAPESDAPEVSAPEGITLAAVRGFVAASEAYGAADDALVAEGERLVKSLRIAGEARKYAEGGIVAHKPEPGAAGGPHAGIPGAARRPVVDNIVVQYGPDAPSPIELLRRASFSQATRQGRTQA